MLASVWQTCKLTDTTWLHTRACTRPTAPQPQPPTGRPLTWLPPSTRLQGTLPDSRFTCRYSRRSRAYSGSV